MDIALENKDKIVALLNQGVCPLCNGKYVNPLKHIARTHAIPANDLKDTLLLPRKTSFLPPEQSDKHRQTAIEHDFKSTFSSARNRKDHLSELTREKMKVKRLEVIKDSPELLEKFKEGANRARVQAVSNSNEINRRSVIRISPDGVVRTYKSMSEAGRDTGLDSSNVSRCIKYNRLDHFGNKWILKEEGLDNEER
jgi:hypothetical protein